MIRREHPTNRILLYLCMDTLRISSAQVSIFLLYVLTLLWVWIISFTSATTQNWSTRIKPQKGVFDRSATLVMFMYFSSYFFLDISSTFFAWCLLYLDDLCCLLLGFASVFLHWRTFHWRPSHCACCVITMVTNVCGHVCSRPDHMFQMMIAPWKFLWNACCSQFKWLIIKAIVFALLGAMVGLFFYSAPGYLVKKILGA